MEDSVEKGLIVAAVSIPRIVDIFGTLSRYGKRGYKRVHLGFF